MRKGDCAQLKVEKVLRADAVKEEKVHVCNVLKYDEKQECIFFQLQSSELAEVSPDAIYCCEILSEEEKIACTGRVRERYNGKHGRTLKFQIDNGFYKINIKSLTNI